MYKMDKYYEGFYNIPTDDLLTAVKYSLNYEADLYQDNYLIASWLGLEMEDNIKRLAKLGITTYIKDGVYKFKYTDESKNKNTIWINFIYYNWNDVNQLDVRIFDYKYDKDSQEFNSIEEVINIIKNYDCLGKELMIENIHISDYSDSYKDLSYMLFE